MVEIKVEPNFIKINLLFQKILIFNDLLVNLNSKLFFAVGMGFAVRTLNLQFKRKKSMFKISSQPQLNRDQINSQKRESILKIEKCQYCGHDYDQDSQVGSNLVCKKCGLFYVLNDSQNKQQRQKIKFLGTFIMILFSLVSIYNWQNISLKFFPQFYIKNLNLEQSQELKLKCLNDEDLKCLVVVYQRLLEYKPNDTIYLANLAFTYTKLADYKLAQPIYENLAQTGVGAIDIMYQYAYNSEKLGLSELAIRWYEKSLELDDRYIDLTLSLAKLYAEKKRYSEAASLLEASMKKHPSAKNILSPSLSVILEQIKENPNLKEATIRLVSVEGSHSFVPIRIGNAYQSYMIDTGASTISAPTQDIKKSFPHLIHSAIKAKARLADNRVIDIYYIKVPELYFASWKFNNVEVAFCDQCSRLVGMNLLSQMNMSFKKQGQLQFFQFERKIN